MANLFGRGHPMPRGHRAFYCCFAVLSLSACGMGHLGAAGSRVTRPPVVAPESLKSEQAWVQSWETEGLPAEGLSEVADVAPPPALNLVEKPVSDSPFSVQIPPRFSLCGDSEDTLQWDSRVSTFTPEHALSSLWLAKVVQMPDADAVERLLQVPQSRMRLIRYGGQLQAAVLDTAGGVLVTLRGTQEALDYIQNGLFVVRSGAKLGFPGRIHAGFFWNYAAIWQQLEAAVLDYGGASKGVWINGHSLGGTVASLLAYHLNSLHVPVLGVYKFGSPIAGDVTWADEYNSRLGARTFVMAHDFDITPHIPPPRFAAAAFAAVVPSFASGLAGYLVNDMNYGHVGSYFHFGATRNLRRFSSYEEGDSEYWSEMRETAGRAKLPLLLAKYPKYVLDHDTTNYYCHLKSALARAGE